MTSYTLREQEHIPGSFPTDDMLPSSTQQSTLESSTSHPHHNKLHKREDPRGWVDEGKVTRGHQYTDSGVGLTDPSDIDRYARSRANETAFRSNKDSLPEHAEPNNGSSLTEAKQHNPYDANRKPGVMTGAFSRLDETNYNHPESTTQNAARQETNANRGTVGPTSGTAALVTPESKAQLSDVDLGQHHDLEHDDPYWGDVPYGTGTYNTVTGHGSSETPTEGTIHRSDAQLSHDQERSLPLSTNNNTLHSEPDKHNSSKFTEGAAATTVAGAGVGAGLAASKIPQKQKDDHPKKDSLEEPASHKDNDKSTRRGSKIVSFFHRDHKDKDTKSDKHGSKEDDRHKEQKPSKDNTPLTDRDAGVALAAASGARTHDHEKKPQELERGSTENKTSALYEHPNQKVDTHATGAKDPVITAGNVGSHNQSTMKNINETGPLSTQGPTMRGQPSISQTAPAEHSDSKFGYGLGAAGLGAGAGYAIHEHVNKDARHKGQSAQPAYEKLTTLSETSAQPIHSSQTDDKAQLGTAASAAAPLSSSEKKTMSHPNPHAKVSRNHLNHHQYYILPDGTPSGMNIGDHSDEKTDMAAASPSATRGAAAKDDHIGAKIGAAGAGIAGVGAAAHHASKQSSDKIIKPEPRKGVDLGSNEIHEPYPETSKSQVPVASATTRQGEKHILKDTLRSSNTARDRHSDKSLAEPSTAKESHHAEAAGAGVAATAGVLGAGAAAQHHGKKDSDSKVAPPSTTRDQRSATTSSAHAPHSAEHAAATAKSHVRNRASTDSSHDGQYNVLASGTPSGINREHLDHGSLDGGDEGMEAVHPAVMGTGDAAREKGLGRTGIVAGAGGAGMAAAAASALRKGEPVVHRCGKCGEENDITGYFHE